ncbi:extracellular solute-binding protein [Pokkaliibacter sp. MBI-7]|uniref:ABC transporter substrate-binding protein n=1 Tax=Pokkaliibacter sp. MBI-7 TaxID=3040600 RepID=UPI0024490AC7|nr:extracellular solute-binding protein [Pokkaliibacter sp. MBI-7]MDH2434667.1 extracellular solute-binding protein [Pokkaliibacter sp. MBI-7]
MKSQVLMLAPLALAVASLNVQADTVLNVATAGSDNMVQYVTDYLGPMFEQQHPGVKVNVVGTGPGDAGSQKIYEKLEAQARAGNEKWDIDVAVVHQSKGGDMVREGLLTSYRKDIKTGSLVSGDAVANALGTNVDGYVMPMFQSQTAIAYNPDLVKQVPASYDELKQWVDTHPQAFGYNGIKNGMSGVAFVTGWVYAYGGDAQKLMHGPYEQGEAAKWNQAFADLKNFNQKVTFTPGNAGTLDMLNRGEIAMGPVWVDMFYTWQADGRLNPDLKLKLIAPGMPGQPMYYVVPAKAEHADLAKAFIELATSPKVQAEGIVKKFNWYPGIDAQNVQSALDKADWQKLFTDITPADLSSNARPFPIAPYFDAIKEGYESQVAN